MGGQVIDTNEIDNYLGKSDTTGSELMSDFWDHVHKYKIDSIIGEEIEAIEENKEGNLLKTDNDKEYRAKSVIIASGTQKRHLGMRQEYVLTGKGVHYCATCDGYLYAGESVAVVGGGNSGLEASLDLAELDCNVSLIEVQDNLMGDEYLQKKVEEHNNITVYTQNEVKEIRGEEKLNSVVLQNNDSGEKTELDLAALFIEIGLVANSDFVRDMLDINQQKEIIINNNNETNVKGIWGAGDVTDIKDKQIIVAAAEGAKAATRVNEYLK
jgi:alkyl hydroperoxide reductase subunit F